MKSMPKTDVVIIGLGAAGGVAADVLTKAGLKVVALEAGPYLTTADFLRSMDEINGAFNRNVLGDFKFNKELPTWRTNRTAAATDPPFVWPMMNAVGGGSIHYGAQSWRFSPGDFRVRSSTIKRYGESALPPGSSVEDWPINYEELERYYDLVEHSIGVSGRGGSNPFEGRRSRDYPMPPLRRTGFLDLVEGAMRKCEYHPFPQPAAINSVDYDGRAACSYCGYCAGYGCWNDSKSSTLVSSIRHAEATGNLEIRSNCSVTHISVDHNGMASGVHYRNAAGEIVEQQARFVVLSSYTYESVRRLLLSTSPVFPRGLANNHGQVGRHFMAHTCVIAGGLFPGRHLNLLNGSTGQGVVIDDLNGDHFDHSNLGFIQGGIVFATSQQMPITAAQTIPPDVPRWGKPYKDWLRVNANSVATMIAQIETLPYASNFLDLDPKKVDPFGDPVIRVTYDIHDNEKRAGAFFEARLGTLLTAMGASKTWTLLPATPVPISTHACGGTRMGDDPATSVVDRNCITHEVPNLAVLSGSSFVTMSGYNPTQTIQALSWKSAEFVASNFSKLTN